MNRETILKKLNSVILCLIAHPDNEPNSEFADRIDDLIDFKDHFSLSKEEEKGEEITAHEMKNILLSKGSDWKRRGGLWHHWKFGYKTLREAFDIHLTSSNK